MNSFSQSTVSTAQMTTMAMCMCIRVFWRKNL
jgi:hypothetical protein